MSADDRSFATITKADLKRLARIARTERDDFFKRHAEWRLLYGARALCGALTGAAALHFINGSTGIAEFDVFTFYAHNPDASFPYHRVAREDFGKPKFGRLPGGPETFTGRPVNLTGRDIDASPADDPVEALHAYLKRGATPSARELRDHAVVLIEPERLLGYVVWPTLALARK
ncbi:MAG TPA: hypothetical protein VMK05_16370 [Burkholderiales bacterium]|nr:hypothetical protein [Burkholderiales bacterium]